MFDQDKPIQPPSPQVWMAWTVCRLSQLLFSYPRRTILTERWHLLSEGPLMCWVTRDNSSCLSVLLGPQACSEVSRRKTAVITCSRGRGAKGVNLRVIHSWRPLRGHQFLEGRHLMTSFPSPPPYQAQRTLAPAGAAASISAPKSRWPPEGQGHINLTRFACSFATPQVS